MRRVPGVIFIVEKTENMAAQNVPINGSNSLQSNDKETATALVAVFLEKFMKIIEKSWK